MHRQACVDEGDPFAIPTDDRLVGLETFECPHAVLIDVGEEVVDQHPPVPIRGHAGRLFGWLTRPPDDIPDVIKAVARHTHRAQVIAGEEFEVSDTALPELATVATTIYA